MDYVVDPLHLKGMLAAAVAIRRRKEAEKRKKKRVWVTQFNKRRDALGVYATMVKDLRADPSEIRFYRYLRMSVANFDHLLALVRPLITKQDTVMRPALKPELKLVVTLHHLAQGASHGVIATHYRLGKSTVSRVIYETCEALWMALQPLYLQAPTGKQGWEAIADEFLKWDFPNCLGSIDGKHVFIQKPRHGGSVYHNYKNRESIVLMAVCDAQYRVRTREDQLKQFWKYGDFGQVDLNRASLHTYCKPQQEGDSSLACSDHTKYCRAEHLYFDIRGWSFESKNYWDRFKENLFKGGKIGGHCKFDKKSFSKQGDHKSSLQSWYGELEDYTSLNFKVSDEKKCDYVFDKPTYIIKLDAAINMYHHFCDFVNLYVSQHVNNSFSLDNYILMWDTSKLPYKGPFESTWQAFSKNPIIPLYNLRDKRVCIKEAVFSLLPRQPYGLYYNMPLVGGCENTALFRAFSEHLIHRLQIPQHGPVKDKVRVTLLSRQTKHRNIINEAELIKALEENPNYEVRRVVYNNNVPFAEQLETSHNSDVFICMHGAGLTHMLFQPHWGAVIELFNCGDPSCYLDLARLRGVKYFTWTNMDKLDQEDEGHHPKLGAHQKFTNYGFDRKEFTDLVGKAASHVLQHSLFKRAQKKLYSSSEGAGLPKDEL